MSLSIRETIKLPDRFIGKSELERLTEALIAPNGYTAFFVVSDSVAQHQNLYSEIKQQLSRPVQLIELQKTSNILNTLHKELASSTSETIFYILGLDLLFEDLKEIEKNGTLDILQTQLDDFTKLNHLLIFAIPIHLIVTLQQNAPAFWGGKHGLFMFEERFESRELQLDFLTDSFFNFFGGDPFLLKRELLVLFEALNKEYQSHPLQETMLLYANNLSYTALLFYELGEYGCAIDCYSQLKTLIEPTGNELALMIITNNIANAHQNQGEYLEAKGIYKRILKKYKQAFREHYLYKFLVVNNIGWTDHLLGDNDEALNHTHHALGSIENNFNSYQIELTPVLNLMGTVYLSLGEFEEALDCFRRVLQICERKDDLEHPYIASIMHNIGMVYKEQGHYDDALDYFYRWLEEIEEYSSPEHPKMAQQIFNVGEVYLEKGEYEKSLRYFAWALETSKKTVARLYDPDTGKILHYAGKALRRQGKNEQAKEYFDSAQQILRTKLPSNHPIMEDYKAEIEEMNKDPQSEKQGEST